MDIVEPTEEGNFCFGRTLGDRNEIRIATKDMDGKPLPDNIIETTYYHEMMHAVLGSGQYNGENCDEPLVEWLGKVIRSLVKNKVLQ